MVKVKICGITNLEDAKAAAEAGADFLGFNFYPPSPRCVEPEKVREIITRLGSCSRGVGVFVNEDPQTIKRIMETAALDVVQLHGDEDPEFCSLFDKPVIKAFRVAGKEDMAGAERFKVWATLIDGKGPGYGGTGVKSDWGLAAEAAGSHPRTFLAGGLTPENVAEAIMAVRPWGVDAASGVESEPGKKDPDKIFRFVKAAKNVS